MVLLALPAGPGDELLDEFDEFDELEEQAASAAAISIKASGRIGFKSILLRRVLCK